MSQENSAKIAFVTGGNRGIGFDTATGLARLGMTVVIGTRDPARGEEAADKLRGLGLRVEALACDVANPDSRQQVYEHLAGRYGRLDVLVNNAGISEEDLLGPNNAGTVTEAVLRRTFDVNFFSVVALTQILLPLLRAAPAARIVNVSSVLGSLTLHATPNSPIAGVKPFAYDASKTALNAFTVHLADALKDTLIKVNSGHPGWVRTELGGANAPMDVEGSGATSIALATLPADGPTGGYFHLGQPLPW
jgi:NAD(P)-dependent dehydrogenase (short-subunit alcohol dehydrogenase family)